MQDNENTKAGFVDNILPWLVAALGLVVYIITLNHWVTAASLPLVAKVANWDWWSLSLQAPLFYLVTIPLRGLPVTWHPVVLNLLSAVLAAGTLGLLARCVTLLPHDRTREQRQRERSEFSLLTIPTAWVPPLLAALACGFQLSFWENATAATGEMLNLFLFAYIVRCLLEYRIDPRDAWLYRLALIYGLAVTNNWAMIGFFVPCLAALLWILGKRFFRPSFMLKMAGFGLLGLLLYLLLPLVEKFGRGSEMGLWELLRVELGMQKAMLFRFPRVVILVCSLTSLLPVLVMGFRWPSSFGDVSVLGAILTNLMFRVVHVLFLVICGWVILDPSWSPRALGYGFAFLPLYFLSALSVGYFSGYFLLVFGTEPEKRRHHVSDATRLINYALVLVVWVALIALPAALIYKNWPKIRANNGPYLHQMASELAQSLPAQGALVLSDDPFYLLLVEAALAHDHRPQPHLLIDTVSLPYHVYQRHLHQRYPRLWPDLLTGRSLSDPLDRLTTLNMLLYLAASNATYYLHPPYNYYAEGLQVQPRGLAYLMKPYVVGVITNSAPPAPEMAGNMAFWNKLEKELNNQPEVLWKGEREMIMSDAEFTRRFYSLSVNYWGCELQRLGHLAQAGQCFALACKFNPNNLVALVNQEYNRSLAAGKTRPLELTPARKTKIEQQYRNWQERLSTDGPFDEPQFCAEMGKNMALAQPALIRQAIQQLLRVQTLDPSNLEAQRWLANLYLKWPMPEKTLEVIHNMETRQDRFPLNLEYQIEVIRLRAWAFADSSAFVTADILNMPALAAKLKQHADPVSAYLWQGFSGAVSNLLSAFPDPTIKTETMQNILAQELNRASLNVSLYDSNRFAGVVLSPETRKLLEQTRSGDACVRLNRRLLEDAFAPAIVKSATLSITNLDGAVMVLREAQQKYPTVASLPGTLAQIYLKYGLFTNAQAAFEQQLRLDPKDVEALMNKGAISMQLGHSDQAIPPLSQVLQADPKNEVARLNRATVYLQNRQWDEAKADYEVLLENFVSPEIYRVYYGLGEIYYQRKDFNKSRKYFELYLKTLPRGPQGLPLNPNDYTTSQSITNRLKELK